MGTKEKEMGEQKEKEHGEMEQRGNERSDRLRDRTHEEGRE